MDSPQTSSPEPQAPRSWPSRNAKWLVPLLVVFVLFMVVISCAGVVMMLVHMIKSSEPHRMGMDRVLNSPVALEVLGEPIDESALIRGNLSMTDDTGSASLQVPVTGPKGRAMVYIEATRTGGVWALDELRLEVEDSAARYDLLEGKPLPPAEAAPAP